MGRAKEMQLEIEQRGWADPGTFVCPKCVEDEHLKRLLTRAAVRHTCDYCHKGTQAAPIDVLLEAVFATAFHYYSDPCFADVPYDQGYLVDGIDFGSVLECLEFEGHPDLVAAVVEAELSGSLYVPAEGGDWMATEQHEVLSSGWKQFANTVKHRTRFHFRSEPRTSEGSPYELDVCDTLPIVTGRLRSLITQLPAGQKVYRARIRHRKETWTPNAKELGAPPPDRARAGRMNPAGIPYLYTSFDATTARREIGVGPRNNRTVFDATFALEKPLTVIDLTQLPDAPSVFDLTRKEDLNDALFFRSFVREISAKIAKDGREHIEYVPSQVISEYLAQEFDAGRGRRLGGLIFPSAAHPGGKNLVIFPDNRGALTFHGVNFVRARH